jgi:hypothetical protein
LPRVGLGLALPGFVQRALADEKWHDLVQQLDDNEKEDEGAEHLIL